MLSTQLRLSIALALALAVSSAACEKKQDDAPTEEAVAQPAEKEAGEDAPAKKADPGANADKDMKPHSSGMPGTMNQLEWDQDVPDVTLDVLTPKADEVLKSGDEVSVSFSLTNYRTGKEIGQHVHVILDNDPYIAHYDASEPLVLKDVAPGTHTLRVFPARHYHLSLKKGEVFKTIVFHVEKKSEEFGFDSSKPYVTYSRPKGTYKAAAAKQLLLDFYVSNAELGEDAKVQYSVDGKQTEVDTWEPVLLEELAPGEHKIELKLVDMDGKVIENGGYNDTKRTITVE